VLYELPLRYRGTRHHEEKARIALAAVDRVPEGVAIGMTGGTTTTEVARVLHLSRTTVYTLISDGSLRPVHIGRSCRITRAELERFVGELDAA